MERPVLDRRPMRHRFGSFLVAPRGRTASRGCWVVVSSLAIAAGLVACGAARMPTPRYVPQPTSALVPADFPPPPGRVEFVPAEPEQASAAVWIDGEWTWQGRRWSWKPGRWVVAPAGASFSPWTTTRDALGNLLVAEGRWRDADGGDVPDPKPLAVARRSAGTVVDPEGDPVPEGPRVPAQALDGAVPLPEAGLLDIQMVDVAIRTDALPATTEPAKSEPAP